MKISSGIIHCHSIQKAKIIPRMKKKKNFRVSNDIS